MSGWQRVCVVAAAWFAIACVVAPLVGRRLRAMQPRCPHCHDEGALVVNERPPRLAWCNFCMLGQQYEKAARAAWNQGENR